MSSLKNNTVTIFQGGVTFDPTGIVDQSVVNGVKKKYRVGINVRGAATYIASRAHVNLLGSRRAEERVVCQKQDS